ncbi:hypothetical protein [Rufibacter ruber]|uniref:hypothetical protein n=1 Tax=Rufibacter ruber TaxID=1783499 RepID=UPI00083409F2|nr:hypothetical protein [Rufibacter ruber]
MTIEMSTVLTIVGYLATAIGALITWNIKVTKLESRIESNEKNIDKLYIQEIERNKEMKEVKDLLQQVLLKLTELETYQKIKNETK